MGEIWSIPKLSQQPAGDFILQAEISGGLNLCVDDVVEDKDVFCFYRRRNEVGLIAVFPKGIPWILIRKAEFCQEAEADYYQHIVAEDRRRQEAYNTAAGLPQPPNSLESIPSSNASPGGKDKSGFYI